MPDPIDKYWNPLCAPPWLLPRNASVCYVVYMHRSWNSQHIRTLLVGTKKCQRLCTCTRTWEILVKADAREATFPFLGGLTGIVLLYARSYILLSHIRTNKVQSVMQCDRWLFHFSMTVGEEGTEGEGGRTEWLLQFAPWLIQLCSIIIYMTHFFTEFRYLKRTSKPQFAFGSFAIPPPTSFFGKPFCYQSFPSQSGFEWGSNTFQDMFLNACSYCARIIRLLSYDKHAVNAI